MIKAISEMDRIESMPDYPNKKIDLTVKKSEIILINNDIINTSADITVLKHQLKQLTRNNSPEPSK